MDDLGHAEEPARAAGAIACSLAAGGGPPAAFERRLDLLHAEHASGVTGMLVLPQSFG
jgi:hypothetical protein